MNHMKPTHATGATTPDDHPLARLVAYLDDALPGGARAAVAAHLETCAACRAELDALAHARARVATLPDAGPLWPVWPAVRARLHPEREPLFTPWFRVAAGAAAVAGFAIALVLGFNAPRTRAQETDPLASLGSSLSSASSVAIADPGSEEAGQ